MMSEIPCTPCRRMSSAMRNDSKNPAFSATASSFSFGNHDRRVNGLHQLGDALLGLRHPPLAFKGKRLGDDGDSKRAHLTRQRRDDRSRARARAAAEAGGHEHHVSALKRFDDFVRVLKRGLAPYFRIRARTQPVRELHAELQLHRRARHAQRLQVGVGDDELDALHSGINHAVDRVPAATAHADHLDLGVVERLFVKADANARIVFHNSPIFSRLTRY